MTTCYTQYQRDFSNSSANTWICFEMVYTHAEHLLEGLGSNATNLIMYCITVFILLIPLFL